MGHAGLNLLVDVVRQQASIMAFIDVTRVTAIFAAMALFLLPWFHSKKSLRKSNPKLPAERTNREIKIKSYRPAQYHKYCYPLGSPEELDADYKVTHKRYCVIVDHELQRKCYALSNEDVQCLKPKATAQNKQGQAKT